MKSAVQRASFGEVISIERVVQGRVPVYLFQQHAARYQFIRDTVRGKRVLDMGCGDGYGCDYLAQHASSVVGIDISQETIVQAQTRYQRPNLTFTTMDSTNLSFPAAHFDVVCSFEVIEHVP